MDEEEMFEELETKKSAFQEQKKSSNFKGGGKFNANPMWDSTDFTPKKIVLANLKKEGDSFTVFTHEQVPEDVRERFLKAAKGLKSKGYTFRHNGEKADEVQNGILAIEDIKIESYLPWKKFNDNIKDPKVTIPTKDAYNIAFSYNGKLDKLPPAVRTIIATQVECLLDNTLTNPCDIILSYSKEGHEHYKVGNEWVSWSSLGKLKFVYQIAEAANIAIFNLSKDDAIERLVEYLKSKN